MSFKPFPQFSHLTFGDIKEYERLIKDFPPIADISFAGVMGWWGLRIAPEISILNGNLVISYLLEGDDKHSGLCLVGMNNIDESICTIFDYLKEQGRKPRLVHVPEFVIDNMRYPELFNFRGERDYDEYIVNLSKFYPLGQSSRYQKHRVDRFVEKMGDRRVQVGPIDLSRRENQTILLDSVQSWPVKGINSLTERENEALRNAIMHAEDLGLHNVCLSIDNELHSFLLFQAPFDKRYVTLEYVRMSYKLPHIFNFATYIFSEWFVEQDVEYVNLCMDYGKPILRVAKLALSPVNFFRKYTLEPVREPATSAPKLV
jgi:hypothetical protein